MSNLLPYQHRLLTRLKNHESWIIANKDKKLGPSVIELTQYSPNTLSYLDNPHLYEPLTEAEADAEALCLEREINTRAVIAKRTKEINKNKYIYIFSHTENKYQGPI